MTDLMCLLRTKSSLAYSLYFSISALSRRCEKLQLLGNPLLSLSKQIFACLVIFFTPILPPSLSRLLALLPLLPLKNPVAVRLLFCLLCTKPASHLLSA